MTGDALDRAAQAAYESRFQPDGHWLPWGALSASQRLLYSTEAAAVLRVMADDLYVLHTPRPWLPGEPWYRCSGCNGIWPCTTRRILDSYTGSSND